MDNTTHKYDAIESSSFWPIRSDGPLPEWLFDTGHLCNVFLKLFPQAVRCSASDIRHAFKALIKREASSLWDTAPSEEEDRARWMVVTVCNNAALRNRLPDVKFNQARARGRGRLKHRPPQNDLSHILWRGYLECPEMKAMIDRLDPFLTEQPDLPKGKHLISDVVKSEAFLSAMSNDLHGDDFARTAVIFSALLPRKRMCSLLAILCEMGCRPLQRFLQESSIAAITLSNGLGGDSPYRAPTLRKPSNIWTSSSEHLSKLIAQVHAGLAESKTRSAALVTIAGQSTIAALVAAPQTHVDAVLIRLSLAREAHSATEEKIREADLAGIEALNKISQAVGFSVELRAQNGLTAEATLHKLRVLESLENIVASRTVPHALQQEFRGWSSYGTSVGHLEKLRDKLVRHRDWEETSLQYLSDLAAAWTQRGFKSEAALSLRSGMELAALATACHAPEWALPCAILARAAFDKDATQTGEAIADILCSCESAEHRRAVLYFLSPQHISHLKGKHAKRIAALEYIRDSLEFGPVARLSEPHVWLNDHDIVGRVGHELIELLITNADLTDSAASVSRLLRPAGDMHARRALLAFVSTPIGMQGNFKRLRERARDRFFSPLLTQDLDDRSEIENLLATIESKDVGKEIYDEIADHRPGELEPRHLEQLERYIARGTTLLKECSAELAGTWDDRETSVRNALARTHSKLAKSEDGGGLFWFEYELRKLLLGSSLAPVSPTFRGETSAILGTPWDVSFNDWAAQSLDMACLHTMERVSVEAVASEAIVIRANDSRPSKDEILETLLQKDDLKAALLYARSDSTEHMENRVRDFARDETERLEKRLEDLRSTDANNSLDDSPDTVAFERFIRSLDLARAEESLDLIELALADGAELRRKSEEDRQEAEDIGRLLRESGYSILTNSPLALLREQWKNVLNEREAERYHFQAIFSAWTLIDSRLPELSSALTSLRQVAIEPAYWLDESSASDFGYVLGECAGRISRWAENASLMKQEERHALSVLAEWFASYVPERVYGLRTSDDVGAVQATFGRLMEVADSVTQAESPVASLRQLSEVGEFAAQPSWLSDNRNKESAALYQGEGEDRAVDLRSGDIPESIAALILQEEWILASQRANELKDRLDPDDAYAMRIIASACLVLAGSSRDCDSEALEGAVTLLVKRFSGVTIPAGRRVHLAQRIVAAAFIAESPEGYEGLPKDITWSQLLAFRNSPLRRQMSGEGLANRIVNDVLLAFGADGLAQAIWDGASGSADAAQQRTALLLRIHDLELLDVLYKVAARSEPGLASRLNQLFELRNVASTRPDLVPVAIGVADQIAASIRSAPFKAFLKSLPVAAQQLQAELQIRADGVIVLEGIGNRSSGFDLNITVVPFGLVPERTEVSLLADDDVTFAEGGIRRDLSLRPMYVATEYSLPLQFGASWRNARVAERGVVRIRVRAKTLTGEVYNADAEVKVSIRARPVEAFSRLDDDTLLDAYPGVSNTPAIDTAFFGRLDELETLHKLLISSRRPSPVLLIGLRRIGKTSLMFALHRRHRSTSSDAITFYLSLAERRVELASSRHSVSSVVFGAIVHGLVRQNLSITDQNHDLCARIRDRFGGDLRAARDELRSCFDEESLADSLSALRGRIAGWIGRPDLRLIVLIDEAEALVAAYNLGGLKRAELEQLLQSIRELSQRDEHLAFLLAGSNHINVFAREYKNAFFGSSQIMELGGLSRSSAPALISPSRIAPFVQFDPSAISYAYDICAGMPQFLWQLGAATSYLVRAGIATRSDVRRGVGVLTSHDAVSLPFKSYEILEPIDSVLGLESEQERDLLWMLLYKIAQSSSLIVEDAATAFVIDQSLLQIDEREAWKKRVAKLAELGILRIPSPTTVTFQVPIFAEGFRSAKNWQEFNIRQQKVTR